jgi:hypothetical protein
MTLPMLETARRLDRLANERYARFGIKGVHVIATSNGYRLVAGHLSADFRSADALERIILDFGSAPVIEEMAPHR